MLQYNYIVNPLTGRKVKTSGKIGVKILKNYISHIGGFTFSKKFLMKNKRVGCKKRQEEGNKNNIPFIVFFCGALCRLSYEYPKLFTKGLQFLFNMKITE